MSSFGVTLRLGRFAVFALLGACTPAVQYQLDSGIGEQQEETERVRGRARAEEAARVAEAPSRGDDEDAGDGSGASGSRSGPLVTLPGFKILPSGRSRVFVEVTGRAEVTEDDEGRVLKLHLRGVGIPEKVNRLPLVTSHFDTAVERVRVLPVADGADVVIELRAKVEHWTKLKPSRVGTRLTVDFAKPPEKRADGLKATTGFNQEPPERLTTSSDVTKVKSKAKVKPKPAEVAKRVEAPKEESKPTEVVKPVEGPKEESKAAEPKPTETPKSGDAPKLDTASPL
jgi:hypothetical protein